jgi:hypothetical protein
VAVVELFTSEGCSSCPPADKVLAELAEWGAHPDHPVLTLAFHVDYWDDLGWVDPFSSVEYSERQRWYSQRLGHNRVYTPELLVGGTDEFVGSRREQAFSSVRADLKSDDRALLGLTAKLRGEAIVVGYQLTGLEQKALFNVALLQPAAQTVVRRGENQGRTLKHVNVVRRFLTRTVDNGSGELDLAPVKGVLRPRIAAYVQHPESLRVLVAHWLDLQTPG